MPRDEGSDAETTIGAAFESGVAPAAEAIVRLYGAELRGYLVATAHDRDAGEELFQELAEALLHSLPQFRRESSFRTFSYAIAYNLVRRHRRRTKRRLDRLDSAMAEAIPALVRSETESWLRTDARARVAQLREQLSPADQTLLFLRVERAMSWKQIALVLENNDSAAMVAALRKRHERLLRKLREWIRQ